MLPYQNGRCLNWLRPRSSVRISCAYQAADAELLTLCSLYGGTSFEMTMTAPTHTYICSLNRSNVLLLHSLFAGTLVILDHSTQIALLTAAVLAGSLVHTTNRLCHGSLHVCAVV